MTVIPVTPAAPASTVRALELCACFQIYKSIHSLVIALAATNNNGQASSSSQITRSCQMLCLRQHSQIAGPFLELVRSLRALHLQPQCTFSSLGPGDNLENSSEEQSGGSQQRRQHACTKSTAITFDEDALTLQRGALRSSTVELQVCRFKSLQ